MTAEISVTTVARLTLRVIEVQTSARFSVIVQYFRPNSCGMTEG